MPLQQEISTDDFVGLISTFSDLGRDAGHNIFIWRGPPDSSSPTDLIEYHRWTESVDIIAPSVVTDRNRTVNMHAIPQSRNQAGTETEHLWTASSLEENQFSFTEGVTKGRIT